jgi:hypothetical protein
LFATFNGYIGIGPAHVAKGDHIEVMPGGAVPYATWRVRTEEASTPFNNPFMPHFTLVGDCYVHGLMDGEAF